MLLDKAHTTGDYTDFVKLVNELEIEMLNKYLELLKKGIESFKHVIKYFIEVKDVK